MKKFIVIALTALFSYGVSAQTDSTRKSHPFKLDFLLSSDFINTSYGSHFGSIVKAKWAIHSGQHLEWFMGIASRHSYLQESSNRFTEYVDGFTLDGGAYFVSELLLYPFRKKHFFIGVEPYAGVTHTFSKGTWKTDFDNQERTFKHHYTYFDYGVSQSVGVRIRQFSIKCEAWLSLKGVLDGGRFRLADFDSRFLPSIGFGYYFN